MKTEQRVKILDRFVTIGQKCWSPWIQTGKTIRDNNCIGVKPNKIKEKDIQKDIQKDASRLQHYLTNIHSSKQVGIKKNETDRKPQPVSHTAKESSQQNIDN